MAGIMIMMVLICTHFYRERILWVTGQKMKINIFRSHPFGPPVIPPPLPHPLLVSKCQSDNTWKGWQLSMAEWRETEDDDDDSDDDDNEDDDNEDDDNDDVDKDVMTMMMNMMMISTKFKLQCWSCLIL